MAATTVKFLPIVCMMIFFSDLNCLFAESVPTLSASPAVLPYVTAPNISSFFPSPSTQQPPSSAVPPRLEASAPIPSSGEFVGNSLSSSAKFDGGIAILGAGLYFLFVTNVD
ncbi:unnamed protein product [Ilex paraguariensis]|uniref:Arabinogalactan-like protein n=1 Tax=Ilex paraguariensis TaxID=185542 RepID=A0ABC8TF42_9AQUA